MNLKRVVFLIGPYRAKTMRQTVENIQRAEEWALKVWQLGGICLCPHMNTRLFDGALPDEVWLHGATELLKRSDAVALMPGWSESVGSIGEVVVAENIPIPKFQLGHAESGMVAFATYLMGGAPYCRACDLCSTIERPKLCTVCERLLIGETRDATAKAAFEAFNRNPLINWDTISECERNQWRERIARKESTE
jgi:hypothetical protein